MPYSSKSKKPKSEDNEFEPESLRSLHSSIGKNNFSNSASEAESTDRLLPAIRKIGMAGIRRCSQSYFWKPLVSSFQMGLKLKPKEEGMVFSRNGLGKIMY